MEDINISLRLNSKKHQETITNFNKIRNALNMKQSPVSETVRRIIDEYSDVIDKNYITLPPKFLKIIQQLIQTPKATKEVITDQREFIISAIRDKIKSYKDMNLMSMEVRNTLGDEERMVADTILTYMIKNSTDHISLETALQLLDYEVGDRKRLRKILDNFVLRYYLRKDEKTPQTKKDPAYILPK